MAEDTKALAIPPMPSLKAVLPHIAAIGGRITLNNPNTKVDTRVVNDPRHYVVRESKRGNTMEMRLRDPAQITGGIRIKFGCHEWYSGDGPATFEQAFTHYHPQTYRSDGDVVEVREMLRRLQEQAITNGWLTERAHNSLTVNPKIYV